MKIGNLVRHKTFNYYGIIIDIDLEIDRSFRYVEIHWIQGDLSPIWFLEHQLLEVLGESR
jgi:hemimethylated DNA binding protein